MPADAITSGARRRPLRWLAALIPALAVLAAVAAFAPARLKLLGLFPAAVGATAGGLVAYFALRYGVVSRRAIVSAAVVLVPLTLAGYGAGSFFAWRQAREAEVVANLLAQPGGRQMLDRLRSRESAANDVEAEMFAAYRRQMAPPPSAYIDDRLKGLPVDIRMPWAAVVASGELLLGCIAGIGTAILVSRHAVSARGRFGTGG